MSKGGMAKDGMSKDGMSKDGMSKGGMSKDGMSKDGMSKQRRATRAITDMERDLARTRHDQAPAGPAIQAASKP